MNLENVFEWLLATSLRASVLAGVIFASQLLVRRWLPAGWRHALWLPMLVVLVLPVTPEVPFGISRFGDAAPRVLEPVHSGLATAADFGNVAAATSQPEDNSAAFLLAFVWLAGALAVLGAGWLGYHRNMRKIEANAQVPEVELRELIQLALAQTKVRHAPMVLLSPNVESPAVTGLLRPRLLLPAGFPAGFTEGEAQLILLHEFSHLKRLDLPLNWLACVLQAMHWFNPVLWFAFARMRADREAACDARVLAIDAQDRRAEYGGALLKLQGLNPSRALSLGFVGLFERGSEMKSRIREISTRRPDHIGWRVAGGGMITLLLVFGATKAEEPVTEAAVAPAEEMSDGVKYITDKLNSIVLPRIDLEDTTLEEAVDFLRLSANELDIGEKDPAKKGINFVIRKPRPVAGEKPFEYGLLGVKLKNVPLSKVIAELAEEAGAVVKVDDFAVTFLPAGEAKIPQDGRPTGGAPEAAAPQPKAMVDAGKIIIPRIDFENTDLKGAVEFLNLRAKDLAKDQPVPLITLDASADAGARIRELRLRNVPLSVALKYCADQVKLHMDADDKEIRLVKKP
ncbi:MAG: M56 family metallopeptidase [Verrucomicrobiota bacterium]